MKFIDKLERKFGRFGIPNLTIYMIVCYVIGYALMIVNPGILNWLSLEPAYILRGQVWRLVTWVLYPPSTSGVLWFAIAVLFFYYPIGTSLERTIGTFKYTVYIRYLARADDSNFYLCDVYSFGRDIYNFGSVYSVFPSRRKCSGRKRIFYLLYQSVHIPCICNVLSGYAGSAYVYHSGEDEVDGNFLCGDRCI